MDNLAESYVKLVLAVGEHDPDYVDSYFGPPDWRNEVKSAQAPLTEINQAALGLQHAVSRLDLSAAEEIVQLRHENLQMKLQALLVRVNMLGGTRLTFDQEVLGLYGVTPTEYSAPFFQQTLAQLETLLPGNATLHERYQTFRKMFIIAPERLDQVFQAAIKECRERTKKQMELPSGETLILEYVRNKPWSGYNWFKGNGYSLIQINMDLPIYLDRAIDLAAHEGYPGHHVFHTLMEEHLVKKRNWLEFSVYALFTSQSLVSEGSANFGIELLFPGREREEFERHTLCPLAGVDASALDHYTRIQSLLLNLNYAHNEAARHYLNGRFTPRETEEWLVQYALLSPEQARQRIRFIDTYRSYVVNYNLGRDMVKAYVESRGGTADRPQKRWAEFRRLLTWPITLKN